MQWNQAGSYSFQSYPKPVPPAIPEIVGEGDVTGITFPDGSVQFYFVPNTVRQNLLPYPYAKNPYGGLFSCPTNTEVWFVRSITNLPPNINISVPPGNFNIQLPNTFGEYCRCPPYSPPPNYCVNQPASPPTYTQKFHNDIWTSTTDIHYFYPSLRRAKHLQYCIDTQTDPTLPLQNTNGQYGQWNKNCEQSLGLSKQKTVTIQCDSHPEKKKKVSYSSMSVDTESDSEQRRSKKYKKTSAQNMKTPKRDHICECKHDKKGTSNKMVTTYADQTTEDVAKDGRETQTDLSKSKSDIKTKKRKCNKKSLQTSKVKPIIKINSSSDSSFICDYYCTCITSDSDMQSVNE